jgi:hypothetical protein
MMYTGRLLIFGLVGTLSAVLVYLSIFSGRCNEVGRGANTAVEWGSWKGIPPALVSSLRAPSPPRLHLFIPINKGAAGLRFCRSIMTAVLHGYDPVIYNWNKVGDGGSMQIAKVTGMC